MSTPEDLIICRCEEVTLGEVLEAIREGARPGCGQAHDAGRHGAVPGAACARRSQLIARELACRTRRCGRPRSACRCGRPAVPGDRAEGTRT